ncbi:MAG: bifunctional nuclease domain-containing protein [Ignavibacteria bacterium]|jgi:bifunctional DNase/RNase
MSKIQVDILGLSVNPNSQRAYALLLREVDGNRRLPIVIGEPEAQAIANELEGIRPQRPMTHDLLRNVIEALGASIREIVIHSIKDGTFYASIHFEYSDIEIDARPSDAIALAVRCNAPMYIDEEIFAESALQEEGEDSAAEDAELEEEHSDEEDATSERSTRQSKAQIEMPLTERQRLEQELDQAIKVEDYEAAARIRDSLQRLEEP